jgi:hypothetical protein
VVLAQHRVPPGEPQQAELVDPTCVVALDILDQSRAIGVKLEGIGLNHQPEMLVDEVRAFPPLGP